MCPRTLWWASSLSLVTPAYSCRTRAGRRLQPHFAHHLVNHILQNAEPRVVEAEPCFQFTQCWQTIGLCVAVFMEVFSLRRLCQGWYLPKRRQAVEPAQSVPWGTVHKRDLYRE